MVIPITPETLERKTSGSGQPYLSIKGDDGGMYACWIPDLFSHFQEGMTTKAEIKQAGKWLHIIGIPGVKIQNPPPERRPAQNAPVHPRGGRPPFKGDDGDRARGAARGMAFSKACDIVIAMHTKKELKSKLLFKEVERVYDGLMTVLEKNEPGLR